jgi:arylsulfatase A-like enzyme
VRVPFIIQWKGRLPAGRVEDRMASSLDLFPTALAAAGGTSAAALDGTDLLPLLAADPATPIRPRHYWRMGAEAALRSGTWKIFRDRSTAGWELYDLASDPGEKYNLAATEPARLNPLQREWEILNLEMAAPLWGPAGHRLPE